MYGSLKCRKSHTGSENEVPQDSEKYTEIRNTDIRLKLVGDKLKEHMKNSSLSLSLCNSWKNKSWEAKEKICTITNK